MEDAFLNAKWNLVSLGFVRIYTFGGTSTATFSMVYSTDGVLFLFFYREGSSKKTRQIKKILQHIAMKN